VTAAENVVIELRKRLYKYTVLRSGTENSRLFPADRGVRRMRLASRPSIKPFVPAEPGADVFRVPCC